MGETTGLLGSLKRLAETLISICQTRIELISNEIEEERLRVSQMLLYASVALFFFGLAIIFLMVFIVMLFWDNHLLVLGSLATLFFVAGLAVWSALRSLAHQKSKLFSTSLAELANDRSQLAPVPRS